MKSRRDLVAHAGEHVGVGLRELHRPALGAQAVDLRQQAAIDGAEEAPPRRDRVLAAQRQQRDRQLLRVEVLAGLVADRLLRKRAGHLPVQVDVRQAAAAREQPAVTILHERVLVECRATRESWARPELGSGAEQRAVERDVFLQAGRAAPEKGVLEPPANGVTVGDVPCAIESRVLVRIDAQIALQAELRSRPVELADLDEAARGAHPTAERDLPARDEPFAAADRLGTGHGSRLRLCLGERHRHRQKNR
ncbi:MAG: hypothetical protein E6J72_17300 [Deltaproteobacteria bacterium]|nr:MAG: hypothetical protein E6J72_17300 [Deltaproteobacteria bacterium]